MTYIVKSPLVVAKIEDGPYVHLYEGAPLPVNIDKEQLEQLLESDMVGEVDDAPAPVEPDDQDPPAEPPAGNAGRDAWADYARTKGATDDELKDPADGGLSRDALREKYGK